MSEDLKKYHSFKGITMKLKEILPLIRSRAYSNYDDNRHRSGTNVVICPECEDWTHVTFNAHSCLLDLLGDLTVESIDADDSDIWLWIKTDDFNWFEPKPQDEAMKEAYEKGYANGRKDEAGLRDGMIMQTFSPD